MHSRFVSSAVVVLVVAACSPGPSEVTSTTILAPESAVAAVEALHAYLVSGDFESAGLLTLPGQAALASLAEGASPAQVAQSLEGGDNQVATNFWSGFAQGAGEVFLGEVSLQDQGSVQQGTRTFYVVEATPQGLAPQRVFTQRTDGDLIDLFASFGGGLAERMIPSVEALISLSSADAVLILAELQKVVDSLLVGATNPGLSPDAVQSILQLVELITRVG